MKFLHVADVHLGCRRYNLEERTKDFARAWIDVADNYAVAPRVDFVLIAGDFFNSRKVDPQAMNHAILGLQKLRDAGIPVLAIEGNHDQHDATSHFSWMRSLSEWGYLKLLEPQPSEAGGFKFTAWDEASRTGTYIDVAGARIFGTHWYGTSTTAAIPLLLENLRQTRDEKLFNIMMLHTDVEGQINRPIPALPVAKMKELRSLVDYLALGHTHKRFEIEAWAFNPGSLEACTIDEYREERGVYLVEVDDEKRARVEHLRDYRQRPFQRLIFDVSGVASPEEVRAGALDLIAREARRHDESSGALAPIIEITLRGHLGFKNSLLEINKLRDEAREMTNALHVIIRNQSVPVEYAVANDLDADVTRAQRERRIVEDLIARDARFRERARQVAALTIEAKRAALSDEPPARILELIENGLRASVEEKEKGVEKETLGGDANDDASSGVETAASSVEMMKGDSTSAQDELPVAAPSFALRTRIEVESVVPSSARLAVERNAEAQ